MATSIRLEPTMAQRLDQLLRVSGCTNTYLLREFVANGLDDLENHHHAAATMERLRKGKALAEGDRTTWYGGGAKGYTDYPTLKG